MDGGAAVSSVNVCRCGSDCISSGMRDGLNGNGFGRSSATLLANGGGLPNRSRLYLGTDGDDAALEARC